MQKGRLRGQGTREVRLFIERDWLFLVAEIVIENKTSLILFADKKIKVRPVR